MDFNGDDLRGGQTKEAKSKKYDPFSSSNVTLLHIQMPFHVNQDIPQSYIPKHTSMAPHQGGTKTCCCDHQLRFSTQRYMRLVLFLWRGKLGVIAPKLGGKLGVISPKMDSVLFTIEVTYVH